MRKSDAKRRAFLKTFKLRMLEIGEAGVERLENGPVTEDELDDILERTDEQWRTETGLPAKKRATRA